MKTLATPLAAVLVFVSCGGATPNTEPPHAAGATSSPLAASSANVAPPAVTAVVPTPAATTGSAPPALLPVLEDESDDPSLAPTVQNAAKGDVQKVMRGASDAFVSCFREARRQSPTLAGTLSAKFVIDKKGNVTTVSFESGKTLLDDAALTTCVRTIVGALTFPPLRGGIATVRYPMRFAMK